jgi:photosystem II stability/assembly factor-like uncharacterized protein
MLVTYYLGLSLSVAGAQEPVAQSPSFVVQASGTGNRLQAVSATGPRVVWASGLGGTFVRTTDGGNTWHAGVVPGADSLEFRDVEAVSDRVAYLLAAGPGSASRIYKTDDAGRTWSIQFRNPDPKAFFDCFAFWSPTRGIAFSDAVAGRFPALFTSDGRHWEDIAGRLPRAHTDEAAFAASGTCVAIQGQERAWVITGGAAKSRVLVTGDGGATWRGVETPIVSRAGAGGFTVAFRDSVHGIVAGGDLDTANARPRERVAVSRDGGRSWTLASPPPFDGAVFGSSYVPGSERTVVITGPGGTAWSPDEGRTWNRLNGVSGYWAVAFAAGGAGWLVGTDGRILKVSF